MTDQTCSPLKPVSDSHAKRKRLSRFAGVALIFVSLLMIFAMLHHPTGSGHDIHELAESMEHIETVNVLVHGSAIVMLLLLAFSQSVLASRLGMESPWVRLGCVFYAAGLLSMAAAATVSGFLVPGYLRSAAQMPAEEFQIVEHMLSLLRQINRTCDEFGVLGMSIGIFWWSIALCFAPARRWVGIVGLFTGLVGVIGLFSGHLGATLHGVLAFVVLQAVWNVLVGIGLLRDWWSAATAQSRVAKRESDPESCTSLLT